MHDVKSKTGSKLTKQFNIEIAQFDPAQSSSAEIENPYAKATLTQKMSQLFKGATTGKFLIKDNLNSKNLRLENVDLSEEGKRNTRNEH